MICGKPRKGVCVGGGRVVGKMNAAERPNKVSRL